MTLLERLLALNLSSTCHRSLSSIVDELSPFVDGYDMDTVLVEVLRLVCAGRWRIEPVRAGDWLNARVYGIN